MDLALSPSDDPRFKSSSQRARIFSESWAARELYCVACQSPALTAAPTNNPVVDFACPLCAENFQLKAKQGRFGMAVTNSAYQKKIDAIRANIVPNYVFLSYDLAARAVSDLFVVPGFFISESVIRARTPLSPVARRSGWVGSTILLGDLPAEARIRLVDNSVPIAPGIVRRQWRRVTFIQSRRAPTRGWIADVLAVIDKLGQGPFHLDQVYAAEEHLAMLHPNNENIRPKIRQQVQLLRDEGILESLGKGRYSKK